MWSSKRRRIHLASGGSYEMRGEPWPSRNRTPGWTLELTVAVVLADRGEKDRAEFGDWLDVLDW